MDIKTFDQWMETLSTALDTAQKVGLSDNQVQNSARILGNYLAANVVPDAAENKVIKALWEHGNEQERQSLANMMVKLVQSYTNS
jgi:hypothetical protein